MGLVHSLYTQLHTFFVSYSFKQFIFTGSRITFLFEYVLSLKRVSLSIKQGALYHYVDSIYIVASSLLSTLCMVLRILVCIHNCHIKI